MTLKLKNSLCFVFLIWILNSSSAHSSTTRIEGPNQLFLPEGVPFNLTCIVIGDYVGDISWLRDGERINETSVKEFNITTQYNSNGGKTSNLTISDSKFAGVYTCDPKYGDRDSVIVHGAIKANIKEGYSLKAVDGTTVTLTCQFNAGPNEVAGITWLKNGEQIDFHSTKGYRFEVETISKQLVSTLTIPYVNFSDSGNYTCSPKQGDADTIILDISYDHVFPRTDFNKQRVSNSASISQITSGIVIIATVVYCIS